MLKIRFSRVGRKNVPFFKIVVSEHTKPVKKGMIEKLGWYNPRTKEKHVEVETVRDWIKKGAQLSDSVSKMFKNTGINL